MQRRPEIVRHIHEAGHEIGNHGWSHTAFTVLKDEAIIRELKKTTDLIQKVSSQECAIYRPPYGAITEDQQLLIAGQLSYRLVLWNVDSLDWQRPRAEQLILNATTLRAEKSIVLFHDFSDMTRDTLPRILDILLGCNCTFYTASRIVADLEG
jgi:Predicted xylanase/chitin deacetylase